MANCGARLPLPLQNVQNSGSLTDTIIGLITSETSNYLDCNKTSYNVPYLSEVSVLLEEAKSRRLCVNVVDIIQYLAGLL